MRFIKNVIKVIKVRARFFTLLIKILIKFVSFTLFFSGFFNVFLEMFQLSDIEHFHFVFEFNFGVSIVNVNDFAWAFPIRH